jgi:hypothetical protein
MQSQVKTIQFRITTKDLMEVKDAYNLYDTRSAIKFMFEQQFPQKEVILEHGFCSDPCPVNSDAVVITVKARDK